MSRTREGRDKESNEAARQQAESQPVTDTAGQAGGTRLAGRFRTTLATVQIAMSMALLVSAGLFTQSLLNVSRVDLGLRPEQIVTFTISPALNGYAPARSRELFERLSAELDALPGATSTAAGRIRLLSGSTWGQSLIVQGFEAGPDTDEFRLQRG